MTNASVEDVDQLARDPTGFVQSAFRRSRANASNEGTPCDDDWGVRDVANRLACDAARFARVREINAQGGVETVRANELVRFRALVQDMYEPEYYVGAYVEEGENEWKTTKYCEHVDLSGAIRDTALFERRVLYCVPVPGEQPWVGEAERVDDDGVASEDESRRGAKRERDDVDMELCAEEAPSAPARGFAMLIRPDIERVKKTSNEDNMAPDTPEQIGEGEVREESLDQLLNFPLVPESRSPCIVKVYGETADSIKVNDVVEFVGMLYYSPELGMDKRDEGIHENSDAAMYNISSFPEEESSKNPVTSLVPRFHALTYKVTSQNKFVDSTPTDRFKASDLETSHQLSPEQLIVARTKLLDMISNALGGDAFAAELVLMTLVSRVHTRTDLLSLGKFSINLTGCNLDSKESGSMAEVLAAVLCRVCPSVAHLPLTLPALNARSWTPKKDYTYNRLRAGPLQLAASTVLLLDETKLDSGTLTHIGVRNVEALKSLSAVQELEYDFQYHQMRVPVDIPLIVLSDKKSIIQSDAVVPLRSVRNPKLLEVSDEELKLMRLFVAGARMTKHAMSERTSSDIEAEIVEARKTDKSMTQEGLHMMLTMTRLRALSLGQSEVTKQTWIETVELNRRIAERTRVV